MEKPRLHFHTLMKWRVGDKLMNWGWGCVERWPRKHCPVHRSQPRSPEGLRTLGAGGQQMWPKAHRSQRIRDATNQFRQNDLEKVT